MSKKKDTNNEEKIISPDASLPEDKPDKVDMAPPVSDVKNDASTLKRGIAMEKIDSPRYGVPGQASATRAAAGGGAINPSGQVGRSPNNPEFRGAGSDPMNKLDIRDELAWNDIGANQYRTLIEGSAAGFAPDAILGNFTYEDNLTFQFDNSGSRPGMKNSPYRRRVKTLGKDQLCFIAGQHDSAGKAAMRFYPRQTYSRTGNREFTNVQSTYNADHIYTPLERSNYLMRGMRVTISYSSGAYRITGVSFDTVPLPCESTPDDLDVRYDNARVFWDIADRDITETYFGMVNEASNLQANKYSPLPDGQPDAMQHLMLARDVANTDGAIAFLAIRSAMETYALHRSLRSEYGAGNGARAQARAMLAERIAQNTELDYGIWADNENMHGVPGISMGHAENVGTHNTSFMRLSMPEYIQTYLDSPAKYNSNFGVWITQPRGLKLLFEEAQKSFDDCGLIIDKDTYAIINKLFGWHDVDGRLAGVTRMGIITPIDYNELYTHAEEKVEGEMVPTANIAIDANGNINSKYTMVDYVLNGSFYNHTQIRSPLVDAILQVFKYRIMPKLNNRTTAYEYYVPFDFACDHYSFGHAILMEAMAYMHQFIHPAHAVFERFEQQYGVNPLLSDQMQELKLADVTAGSCYKGIGADPVFPDGSEALRLMLYLPEVYQMGITTWDSGLEYPDALIAIKFTDLAPISDDIINDQQTMLFPMLYNTEVMGQWRRIKDMGPEKLLCTRDFPIHRYQPAVLKFIRNDDLAYVTNNHAAETPFFGYQMPQVYHSEDTGNAAFVLQSHQVLCAPRYSGRLAPAPMGMLNFVRVAASDVVAANMACGSFMDLHLENHHDGADGSNTTTYGWMSSPADDIIYVAGDNHDHLIVEERDIDNYTVSFVYMPQYEQNTLGMMLERYFVHFESGALAEDALDTIQNTYGIWISPEQQSVNVPDIMAMITDDPEDISVAASDSETYSKSKYDYIKVSNTVYSLNPTPASGEPAYVGSVYTDITVTVVTVPIIGIERWQIANAGAAAFTGTLLGKVHHLSLDYENDAMKMWVNDNIMEFIYSPFSSNVSAVINAKGGSISTVDHDITMPMMFGLAGYQMLWYDRLNVANYASKQAVGGRVYDDAMLRKSNLFFE